MLTLSKCQSPSSITPILALPVLYTVTIQDTPNLNLLWIMMLKVTSVLTSILEECIPGDAKWVEPQESTHKLKWLSLRTTLPRKLLMLGKVKNMDTQTKFGKQENTSSLPKSTIGMLMMSEIILSELTCLSLWISLRRNWHRPKLTPSWTQLQLLTLRRNPTKLVHKVNLVMLGNNRLLFSHVSN